MGDPAGIGSELLARLLARADLMQRACVSVIGDRRILADGERIAGVVSDLPVVAIVTTRYTVRWRVQHQPARTVYTIQCHDVITLTVGYGQPVPPKYERSFANASRRDEPECWQLLCLGGNAECVVSNHPTKEEARTALLAARRARTPFPDWARWLAAMGQG